MAQAASQRSLGGPTKNHLPRAAAISSHGPTTIATAANIAPPQLHSAARRQCPRTACDQAVVIPHDGQRVPNIQTNVQGGKPSCWCVPNPVGLGRNQAATSSGAIQHSPMTASKKRRLRPNRKAPWKTVGVTLIAGNEPEDSENAVRPQERKKRFASHRVT
jgi:hypothetical protein